MAAMREHNAALRDGPNGAKKPGKVALAGDPVTELETRDGWSHIRLNNGDEGWVDSTLVDTNAAGPPPAPIERQKFANSCVIQALISGVNPHYLLGVAQHRSGLTRGNVNGRIGPYRFTAAEWQTVVPPFTVADINSNNQQIGGFAVMTERNVGNLGANASPVELYRAQWPDAPNDIGDKLKAAFDATADIEAKAEEAILDPHVVDSTKAGPALQKLTAANGARWQNMVVTPGRVATIDATARRLVAPAAKQRYESITGQTQVPWFIIAVIHQREASQDFNANIAQGDPWNQRSVRVPAGRGPFASFEDAAVDALTNCAPRAARWGDWTIGGALTLLEQYNGLGYALRNLPSPYIWASSNQYTKGKFTRDHHFDPNVVDTQLGCAPLLARMQALDASIQF